MESNDNFIAKGETEREVRNVIMKHIREAHPDKVENLSEDGKTDLDIKINVNIKEE